MLQKAYNELMRDYNKLREEHIIYESVSLLVSIISEIWDIHEVIIFSNLG